MFGCVHELNDRYLGLVLFFVLAKLCKYYLHIYYPSMEYGHTCTMDVKTSFVKTQFVRILGNLSVILFEWNLQ
jgi:hypothetical protein